MVGLVVNGCHFFDNEVFIVIQKFIQTFYFTYNS